MILVGDCRAQLRTLKAGSVQTCITSPPYWGLRDYGVGGQIGLEPTPEKFVAELVDVFREVHRVLRDDGTLWMNLGDTYAGSRSGPDGGVNTLGGGRQHQNAAKQGKRAARAIIASHRRDDAPVPRSDVVVPGLKPKQLIGVPWRVAFAMQQPLERVHIKDRTDRAWLAALVDGEGCLTIMQAQNGEKTSTSFPPVMQIKMTDPECIQYANAITGFEQCLRQDPPSLRGNRETFQWRITSRRAADIVAEIYPYLRIKRRQAIVLWNHQLVRDSYETKRGQPMPAEARAKQIQCRDLIQRLNRREAVDLPSWMVEPAVAVEPGWYLRQDVIWNKPNPMPESVRDRCTKAHEYLFLLTKSERYYFDQDAIREQALSAGKPMKQADGWDTGEGGHGSIHRKGRSKGAISDLKTPDTRNKRSVWTIPTQAFSEAHFATFPEALVEPCILAGSRPGDLVLDPFMGAGTTAVVAERLSRRWVGCELNPEYAAIAEARIRNTHPGLPL